MRVQPARAEEKSKKEFPQNCFIISFLPYSLQIKVLDIFYYIDTIVLLENIPLVKFIKTTSGTRVLYFS